MSDEGKKNRRDREADQRRDSEAEERRRREQAERAPPEPGTVAWAEAQAAASRAALEDAPDLRSAARQEVDRVWSGMRAACVAKFGRAPSTDPHNQPSDELALAFANAEHAESEYLGASHAPGASDAFVADRRAAFGVAVLTFANAATKGWPTAAVYREQERRRMETW